MLRRAILFVALTVCFVAPFRYGRAQTHFQTEFQQDRDVVQIPFEYYHHQIIIHADTDERKGLTMLFDSGASSPTFDTALNLHGYHLSDGVIHEAEGTERAETIWLSELSMHADGGTVTARNVPALITDLSQVGKVVGRHIDGICGISFIAGFVVEIDYQKQILKFYNPRNYTIATRVPDNQRTFLLDGTPIAAGKISSLTVKGQINAGYEYDFLVDTGFAGYASIAQAAAIQSGLYTAGTPSVVGTGYSVSHQFRTMKVRASFMMLGEINLSRRIVQVDVRNGDRFGQSGIIGNRLLQNYRVTLDYARKKILLERATEKEEPDDSERPILGVTLSSVGGAMVVKAVNAHSPADRSGMKVGDQVVSIDDRPIKQLDYRTINNTLNSPRDAVTFTLNRGANQMTVTVVPASPYDWYLPGAAH